MSEIRDKLREKIGAIIKVCTDTYTPPLPNWCKPENCSKYDEDCWACGIDQILNIDIIKQAIEDAERGDK